MRAARIESLPRRRRARPGGYLRDVVRAAGRAELLAFRDRDPGVPARDVLRVVLSRAARSARRDRALRPRGAAASRSVGEYWCHKHRRDVSPGRVRRRVSCGRYTLDALARIEAFARVRDVEREATVLHGDAARLSSAGRSTGSSPRRRIRGLIDYHEQHRYAYELLELDDRREREIGAAAVGTSLAALEAYRAGIAAVLAEPPAKLRPGAPILIVVNDRRDLYPAILERAGLGSRNGCAATSTVAPGRRAGEYYEDVLVARAA